METEETETRFGTQPELSTVSINVSLKVNSFAAL
jgi:hypothetical protein